MVTERQRVMVLNLFITPLPKRTNQMDPRRHTFINSSSATIRADMATLESKVCSEGSYFAVDAKCCWKPALCETLTGF